MAGQKKKYLVKNLIQWHLSTTDSACIAKVRSWCLTTSAATWPNQAY